MFQEFEDAELFEEEAEEYTEVAQTCCDECGAVLEELYAGMVMCEECGKHFPEGRQGC
ncbi:hypothetical protein LCGC14_2745570 [marine sediment metagenome]|uniref:Uncharacterized protein n=1 Tax=marine sediment metagenome TaxID=412755 RepID=A0A0F8Z3B1_9ZZZZ